MFPDSDTRTYPATDRRPPEETPPRGGNLWSSLITALGMLLLGVGLGWLIFATPAEETDQAAPETTVSAQEQPEAPAEGSSGAEEPVAAVAEALLPSVVQIQTPTGEGSGVIYDSEGLILTAAHVVAGNDAVIVRLSDGSQFEGTVLGGDPATDIAVVEVEGGDLPAAPLAVDGDLQVGQLAVAIGSPFGLDSTVTSGVVSAVNQTVGRGGNFQSLIQTDAAINPGNSGGPLVNRDGEVIGINVSIFSTSGGNVGVGFAVPIDVASDLADSVVAGEPIERAILGITGTNTESGTAGALVTGVVEGSGAAEAGIQVGDAILSVEGVEVQGIGDLVAQLGTYDPGDTVTLEIIRGGETMEIEATLGSQS
ncbi:MAG TPA: trypsin-like peptidase domain-containing protein [Acidimicrobiia bacterium]|nr:trypsin-like peptidase domain-containing protein [Acidimicrobiia bacterium]